MPSISLPGSSSISLTRTRKLTDSLPSTMRWSYDNATYMIGRMITSPFLAWIAQYCASQEEIVGIKIGVESMIRNASMVWRRSPSHSSIDIPSMPLSQDGQLAFNLFEAWDGVPKPEHKPRGVATARETSHV